MGMQRKSKTLLTLKMPRTAGVEIVLFALVTEHTALFAPDTPRLLPPVVDMAADTAGATAGAARTLVRRRNWKSRPRLTTKVV